MTSPITDLETGLFTALNVAAVTGAGLATSGVWNTIAPQTTALPYVIFQHQGGGDENTIPKRMRDPVYTVKALATTKAKALLIDGAVDLILHLGTLTVSGWTNFWLAREDDVNFMEVDDTGLVVYHVGGIYRVRIGK